MDIFYSTYLGLIHYPPVLCELFVIQHHQLPKRWNICFCCASATSLPNLPGERSDYVRHTQNGVRLKVPWVYHGSRPISIRLASSLLAIPSACSTLQTPRLTSVQTASRGRLDDAQGGGTRLSVMNILRRRPFERRGGGEGRAQRGWNGEERESECLGIISAIIKIHIGPAHTSGRPASHIHYPTILLSIRVSSIEYRRLGSQAVRQYGQCRTETI